METYQLVRMIAQSKTTELPETKHKLVQAGVELMRVQGYNATTVDEICAAAAVTKGAFFHYFKSKEDLAKAAIVSFTGQRSQHSEEAPYRKLTDPLARVYGRLDYVGEVAGGTARLTRGCLVGTFAQELAFTHPELRSACQEAFLHMAVDFEKDLAAAKLAYAPNAGFDPKNLALMYVSLFQGSYMMAKVSGSNDVLLANLEQFRSYLHSLFGPTPMPVAFDKSRN